MNGSLAAKGAEVGFLPFRILSSKWFWVAFIIFAALLLFSFTPAAFFMWGAPSAQDFFQSSLGASESLSFILAIISTFIYFLFLPSCITWLIFGRRDPKSLAIGLFSILLVFGSKPLLFSLFSTPFALDGTAQKCYSKREGGIAILERGEGGCGIDPLTGKPTADLTPEIIDILNRKDRPAQEIKYGQNLPKFFDSATGDPLVWYDIDDSGAIRLFNRDGFSPFSGRLLKPVDDVLVSRLENERRRKMRLKAAELSEARKAADERLKEIASRPGGGATGATQGPQLVRRSDRSLPAAVVIRQKPPASSAIREPIFVNEAQGNSQVNRTSEQLPERNLRLETPLDGQ